MINKFLVGFLTVVTSTFCFAKASRTIINIPVGTQFELTKDILINAGSFPAVGGEVGSVYCEMGLTRPSATFVFPNDLNFNSGALYVSQELASYRNNGGINNSRVYTLPINSASAKGWISCFDSKRQHHVPTVKELVDILSKFGIKIQLP